MGIHKTRYQRPHRHRHPRCASRQTGARRSVAQLCKMGGNNAGTIRHSSGVNCEEQRPMISTTLLGPKIIAN